MRSFSSSARLASRSARCAASSSSRTFSASYSSCASGLTWPSVSRRRSSRSTVATSCVAVVALGRLVGVCLLEPAARLVGLGLEPRGLDLDGGDGFGRGRELLPQLDLGRAEPAELRAELAAARGAGVDLPAQRRLEVRSTETSSARTSRSASAMTATANGFGSSE